MDDVEDADLCLAGNASDEETVQFKNALVRQLNVLMEADDADATLVEYICVMVLGNRKKMKDVRSAIEDLLGASVATPLYEWLCEYVRDLCETHEVLRQDEEEMQAMLEQHQHQRHEHHQHHQHHQQQQLERGRQHQQQQEDTEYAEMFQEEEEECGERNGMEQEEAKEEEEKLPERRIGISSVVSQHDTPGLYEHQQQQRHRHSLRLSSSSSSSFSSSSSSSSKGGDRLFSSALQQSVRSVRMPVATPGAAAVPSEAEREKRSGRVVRGSFAEAKSARDGGGFGGRRGREGRGGGRGGARGGMIDFGGRTNGLETLAEDGGRRVVEVVRMPQLQQLKRRTVTQHHQRGRSRSLSPEREQPHHHNQTQQQQQQQQRDRSEDRNVHFVKTVRNGATPPLPPSLMPPFNPSFSRSERTNEKLTVFRITGIVEGRREGAESGGGGMLKDALATVTSAAADTAARNGKDGGKDQNTSRSKGDASSMEGISSSSSSFLSPFTPSPSSGDRGVIGAAAGIATLSCSAPPCYPGDPSRGSGRGSGGYGPIRGGRGGGRGRPFRHHTPYANFPAQSSFPPVSSRARSRGRGGGKNMSLVLTPSSSGATKADVSASAPPTTASQVARGAANPSLISTASSFSSSSSSASSIPPSVTHNRSLIRNPVTGRMTHHKVWVRPTDVVEAAGTGGTGYAGGATTDTDGTTK